MSTTAGNVRIARSGSIFITPSSANASPARGAVGSSSDGSSSHSPRRGGEVNYESQRTAPSPTRNVPRLTALRLQQKLVELDQENLTLRNQNDVLTKRLRESTERQAASGDLSSRLFHEIEKLSAEKAKLEDENKRSKIALSASSRSVVQTLMQKEQADVQAEQRLQSKIGENIRLTQSLAETRQELDNAHATAEITTAKVAKLEAELKAAQAKCTELQDQLSKELQAKHDLVQNTVQLTNQFESRLVKAEGQLLVSSEKAAARQRQAALNEEIEEQRSRLLQDMTQRVRVLEGTTQELEETNAELRQRLDISEKNLKSSRGNHEEASQQLATLHAENEELRTECDAQREKAQLLEASNSTLERELKEERESNDSARQKDQAAADGLHEKVHGLLGLSYKLGYRVYEDTEMLNRSILSPYGGRLPSFEVQAQASKRGNYLAQEAQNQDELDESAVQDQDEEPNIPLSLQNSQ
eukprot:INCI7290.1.p1 GENE.INCI7290.1~~INCI7290.1.p1  ORF type:complete len:472 (-),score=111.76 INCI7290.1:107-1522(-)